MTIKSIKVSTKPFTFNPGDVVYTCDMFGSEMSTVISVGANSVSGAPIINVMCIESDFKYNEPRKKQMFLGDLGVPGYTYDDRPCSLFRSKAAAVAHHGKYSAWLKGSRYNEFNLYDPFDHDYYDYDYYD